MRRQLLVIAALMALAGPVGAAVAVDTVLVNAATQIGVTGSGTAADLVTSTFNVAASRLVVVGIEYESDVGNIPTTLTWTGGTPACATAFTLRVNGGYDDGVGDIQGVEIWTAWTTSACTSVGITHHNVVTITNGIDSCLTAWSISGGQQAIPIGSTGVGPTTSANGTVNVSITNVNTGSMLLGIVGSAGLNTAVTAAANTTFDSNFLNATQFFSVAGARVTVLTSGAGSTTFGGTNGPGVGFRVGAAVEVNDASIGAAGPPQQSLTGMGTRNDLVPPRRRMTSGWDDSAPPTVLILAEPEHPSRFGLLASAVAAPVKNEGRRVVAAVRRAFGFILGDGQ